jgi:hypothetical protein
VAAIRGRQRRDDQRFYRREFTSLRAGFFGTKVE